MRAEPSRWVVALALASSVACGSVSLPPSAPHPLLTKKTEPAQRPTLRGEMVAIPERGRVTVVEFWATYCEPCVAEMPALHRLWQERAEDGLAVVAVGVEVDSRRVSRFLAEKAIGLPVVLDDGGTLAARYRVADLPRTFVVDREGTIRFVADGTPGSSERIRAVVEALLDE